MKKLVCTMMGLCLIAGSANAWEKYWKGLGANDGWNTKWSWNQVDSDTGYAPTALQNAYYDSALVTGSQTTMRIDGAFSLNDFKNEDGALTIVNGGSLAASGYITIGGYDSTTAGKSASLTMTGNAAVSTIIGKDFHIADYIDTTMTMSDTSTANTYNLKMGKNGGDAHLQLNDNAVFNTTYLLMEAGASISVNDSAAVVITRAELTDTVYNDWIAQINGYKSSGMIYSDAETAYVTHAYTYDGGTGMWAGASTVSTIPEPATIGLLGFAGLTLVWTRSRMQI